jgi:hypothetical protein
MSGGAAVRLEPVLGRLVMWRPFFRPKTRMESRQIIFGYTF